MQIVSAASEKSFVDTNIFAYAEDLREVIKRPKALAIIEQLSAEKRMVISTQVINEFCAILLRGKVGNITNENDLTALVEEMEATAEVVVVTTADCTIVYTEDTPGMPVIESVRYINPFVEENKS